ncbi:MAG: ATP-binding protein, partial [Candidatus Omnitrophota bacterium]
MNASVTADSMYLTVVSETERVAVILEHLSSYARLQGLGDSNGLLLVVRELLMNAIVHGNGSNPSRVALIRVTPRAGYFEVRVDDEGGGFDFASLILVLPDDPQTLSGRG